MQSPWPAILRDQRDLLLFRPIRPDLGRFGREYFAWGLLVTWLAGVGRYWDHPNAAFWQYLGLGSVVYVFGMAALIWAFTAPLKPPGWSYLKVLVFVMMTSAPALLYAIPVERFMTLAAAQATNVWFLAIVATWRVGLLLQFLRGASRLTLLQAIVVALLPIALIVTALTALNLEHAVFEIMGGLRNPETPYDQSYGVLFLITMLSILASPVLLIAWIILVVRTRRQSQRP
jgi:hypothetical protein